MGGVAGTAPINSPNAGSIDASSPEDLQAQSPSQQSSASSSSPPQQQQHLPFQTAAHPTPSILTDWTLQQHQQQPHQQHSAQDLTQFIPDSALIGFNPFTTNFHSTPLDYLPTTSQPTLAANLHLEPTFNAMSPVDDNTQGMPWMTSWQDVEAAMNYQPDGLPRMGSLGSNSPTGTYLEVLSLGSGSESGWATVDVYQNYESYQQAHQAQNAAIFNPSQTLHLRTNSDS